MLASTVQFSTYDQTPTPLHRQTRSNPTGRAAVRQRAGPARQRPNPGKPGTARSLRTQQRAYEPATVTTHVPDPDGAVLARGRRCRPNWSAFHPRALSPTPAATRRWATVTARAQLCTTREPRAVTCSLERR